MKKIIMITKVKNEADIIETFLRYHLTIFDRIVIIDNGSIDGTNEIVYELIREGLPIDFVNEAYSDFDEYRFINQYLYTYVRKYNADYVAFLDADEFIVSANGEEPRMMLERLSTDKVHYFYWKTFIYEEDNRVFSFANFSEYRDEEGEEYTKVIVPGDLIINNDIVISAGNHSARFASVCDGVLQSEYHKDIKYYHFPVRSIHQYKKQILLNCIDMIANHKTSNHTGSHWKEMFNTHSIKELDLRNISIHYAFYEGNILHEECLDSVYDIKTRYSSLIESNLEPILLKHSELQALKIKNLRMESKKDSNVKIAIWGTGELASRMQERVPSKYTIEVYVDSNKQKEYSTFLGRTIISPEKLRFFEMELIVIASDKYEMEIRKQIHDVLPYWDEDRIVSIEKLIIDSYKK